MVEILTNQNFHSNANFYSKYLLANLDLDGASVTRCCSPCYLGHAVSPRGPGLYQGTILSSQSQPLYLQVGLTILKALFPSGHPTLGGAHGNKYFLTEVRESKQYYSPPH